MYLLKLLHFFNVLCGFLFEGDQVDELIQVLGQHELQHVIHVDADDVLQCLLWRSKTQAKLLASFGELIMLDGTYKVNKMQMPLYTIAVVDRDGLGQPVAHAILAREDQTHIGMFLEDVMNWHPECATSTFVTDKDFAEINAIKSVLPSAKIFLCRFHIMKAVVEELKHHAVVDRDSVLSVSALLFMVLCCTFSNIVQFERMFCSFTNALCIVTFWF